MNVAAATARIPALRSLAPGWRRWRQGDAVRGYTLLSPTLIVMGVALCLPLALTVLYSFWRQDYLTIVHDFSAANYAEAAGRDIYRTLFVRSLWISAAVTAVAVATAYPMAYFVAFYVQRHKLVWIIMMTLPFWTSYLLRVFAWKVILGYEGAVNSALQLAGITSEPLAFLLYNPTAVVITLIHAWAAFAILPIYVSLEKIDRSLLEAATDLGDGPLRRFLRVTLPLSLPGVSAAVIMIFIPTVGDYVTPALVGGPDGYMIANVIQFQFGKANNWPLGAALSVTSMLIVTVIALGYLWAARRAVEQRR